MIFVDTNVFMYAVGGPHPLRAESREFLIEAIDSSTLLATSAEVLQELMHAYIPVARTATLDAAFALVDGCVDEVWPVEQADVRLARSLADLHPGLGARDLVHLASCRRRDVTQARTFDRAFAAALAS